MYLFIALSVLGVAFNLLIYRRRSALVSQEAWLEEMPLLGDSDRLLILSPAAFAVMAVAAVVLLFLRSGFVHCPEALVLVFGLGQMIAWADAVMNYRFLVRMERCYAVRK